MSDAQQDRAASERGERKAGLAQLVLLLAGICMPVLGVTIIAPVMPQMGQHFSGTPGSDILVPIVLTVPALMIGLTAPFAGFFADKVHRKRLLLIGMAAYTLAGTAPLYLDSLVAIVGSRVILGASEAMIQTCCLTLIGDYWSGKQRARYLGLNTLVAGLAGTLFIALGGLIGVSGWRAPFWLYVTPVLLIVPMAKLLWEPARSSAQAAGARLEPLSRDLIVPCVVTLFGGVVFYALIVELPFVLNGIGLTSSAAVGGISAIMALANAIGCGLFTALSGLPARVLVPLEFGGTAVGLGIVFAAGSVPVATTGAVITGFSTGLLLPTLLVWAVNRLPFAQRGRGNGWWLSALFVGEFFSSLVIAGLGAVAGGLQPALAMLAVLSVAVGGIVLLWQRRVAEPLATPAATAPSKNPASA
ncbi:MFS transporter [Nonomuraea sp. 10N515B]|uniref:MFS transporter n=1 Tax=Nonomuraea sp. 10N515B TaxID=3457422 RepID=UPI003FCEBCD8